MINTNNVADMNPVNNTNSNELFEIKRLLLELKATVNEFARMMPKWISLSDVSYEIGKNRDTIRKYLKNNFEPEVDFKHIGGKIFLSRDVLFLIRRHYEK